MKTIIDITEKVVTIGITVAAAAYAGRGARWLFLQLRKQLES